MSIRALPSAERAPRRAARSNRQKMVAGVCGGIAEHLNVPVLVVRVVFVTLNLGGFAGVAMYAALWFILPPSIDPVSAQPVGLSAADRAGMRFPSLERFIPRRTGDGGGQLAALVAIGAGLVALSSLLGIGISSRLLPPMLLVVVGAALVWQQADVMRAGGSQRRAVGVLRVIGGGACVVAAVLLLVFRAQAAPGLGQLLLAVVFVLGGMALLAAPWIQRLVRDLEAERSERVRTQERADMAAHLHDSVLQTLALIQQQSADPKAVSRLARAQERDLRAWLYHGQQRRGGSTVNAVVREFTADVEDEYGIAVEVVMVGDTAVTARLRPLLDAGREACVNAAKHSGCDAIDVYCEVSPDDVEIFVRDRGPGFDVEHLPDGRMGVSRSILGRMERHGGTAKIRSEPGYGTEVRLSMPRVHRAARDTRHAHRHAQQPDPSDPSNGTERLTDGPAPSINGAVHETASADIEEHSKL
jgi:signal transduction histidine kinase/phage shock protein PspC (stress-responsive transcriptional regulator)